MALLLVLLPWMYRLAEAEADAQTKFSQTEIGEIQPDDDAVYVDNAPSRYSECRPVTKPWVTDQW
jgi:hypothetical protein